MATVKARPNESIESLLKRFKKVVDKSGIISDLRKKEYYEKPSVKRRKAKAAAVKKEAKRQQKAGLGRPRKVSFKWNDDRTKKIYTRPRRPNQGGSQNNRNSSFRSRPRTSNHNSGYRNKPYNKKR